MKQRILCIVKDLKNPAAFEKTLADHDSEQAEIQLFRLAEPVLSASDLFAWQDSLWPNREKEFSYHFLTNLPSLFHFAEKYLTPFFQSIELYQEENPPKLLLTPDALTGQENVGSLYPYQSFLDQLNSMEIRQIFHFYRDSTKDLYCYAENLSQFVQYNNQLGGWLKEQPYFQRLSILQSFEDLFTNHYQKVFFYSVSLTVLAEADGTEKLLDLIQEDSLFTWQNQFFIYYQILSLSFTTPSLRNQKVNDKLTLLYRKVIQKAKKECALSLPYLKTEERNPNLIVMLISQFLTLNHGPTKTALNRLEVLMKKPGMQVILINTAEMVPSAGMLPLFDRQCAGYIESLSQKKTYSYQELTIPFLQCSSKMPDIAEMRDLILAIYRLKPRFVLNIGGNSPTNDLLDSFLPTITISTVPSGLTSLEGCLQVIGRKLTASDLVWLEKFGKTKRHVIEGCFTWSFKPQTLTLTRKDLKLPEECFLLAVVGARLTEELTKEFIEMLLRAADTNTLVVLIGHCHNFDTYRSHYPDFSSKFKYLGFQDDVLAVLECCDLYVNPARTGGGGSVVEAMFKGLPVVTLPGGDVGLGAGPGFHVRDYSEMEKTIQKYREDSFFYQKMSKAARERAAAVMDSAAQFSEIILEAEKRILEFEAER